MVELAVNPQTLLTTRFRVMQTVLSIVNYAKTLKCSTFAVAEADLASHRQTLLLTFFRDLQTALRFVGAAKVDESTDLARAVADLGDQFIHRIRAVPATPNLGPVNQLVKLGAIARESLAAFKKRYNIRRPHWALIPESGGDLLVPEEVYVADHSIQIPKWKTWAKAAQTKLEALLAEEAA